jgi:hypothetical protein
MFNRPVQFEEAVKLQSVKTVLPTTLTSRQLAGLGADLKRRATFSAQTANAQYLDQVAGTITDILAGELTVAQGRLQLKAAQQALGMADDMTGTGGLTTLGSDKRLELILNTNVNAARSYGQLIKGNDTRDTFPAFELVRFEDRQDPRDWPRRFRQAAQAAGDGKAAFVLDQHNRMMARKDSKLWQRLGDLFDDGLGNPYPPFAFNSGMDWLEVERDEAIDLGLITDDTEIAAAEVPEFNEELQSSYEFRDQRLQDALTATGLVKFITGVLVPA